MANRSTSHPAFDLPQLDPHRSLVDGLHQALRQGITDGKLVPGQRLREVAIARHFAVSPTPVREALRRLEQEGLVISHAHRGAAVATISADGLAHLYEIHEVLEAFAVRRAAERGDHDLAPLWTLVDTIDERVGGPDQIEYNRLDIQFHRLLNGLSGNEELADLIEQTHRRIQSARARFDIHLPDRPRLSQAQHRALLDAVARGHAPEAETIAREHIHSVRDPVLRILQGTVGMEGATTDT
jgi:DNA-binding GntR family transcriptional regulator